MDIAADFEIALKAAKDAGQIVMQYFNTNIEVIEKSPNNPVTEADFHADRIIKKALLEARPNYGFLSEETIDDGSRHKSEYIWMVDPIDGTRAFIRGLPHFAISIALVKDGQPILGIIHNPATQETFSAIKGQGAFKNNIKINANERALLEGASFLGDIHMFKAKTWPRTWPPLHIEQRNSIAYRIALVAAGEFDGAIATTQKNDWDIAAAMLIASEAGAYISDHLGRKFTLNQKLPIQRSILVCSPKLSQELLARLNHIQ